MADQVSIRASASVKSGIKTPVSVFIEFPNSTDEKVLSENQNFLKLILKLFGLNYVGVAINISTSVIYFEVGISRNTKVINSLSSQINNK